MPLHREHVVYAQVEQSGVAHPLADLQSNANAPNVDRLEGALGTRAMIPQKPRAI